MILPETIINCVALRGGMTRGGGGGDGYTHTPTHRDLALMGVCIFFTQAAGSHVRFNARII